MTPKKKWSIPVTWEVASIVNVEADSIKEAFLKVKNDESIPLPNDSFYIDGSFRTTYDESEIDLVEKLYNSEDD